MEGKLCKRTTEVSDSSSLLVLVCGHHLLDLSYRFSRVQTLRGRRGRWGKSSVIYFEISTNKWTESTMCALKVCLPWGRSWCSSWWCGSGRGRTDPAAWTDAPLWSRLASQSSSDTPERQKDATHKLFICVAILISDTWTLCAQTCTCINTAGPRYLSPFHQ